MDEMGRVKTLLWQSRKTLRWSRSSLADKAAALDGAPDSISQEYIRDLETRRTKYDPNDPRFWYVIQALGIERERIEQAVVTVVLERMEIRGGPQ
jgi:hypothetical protein